MSFNSAAVCALEWYFARRDLLRGTPVSHYNVEASDIRMGDMYCTGWRL